MSTTPLNIIFAGTPAFAAIALEYLMQSSHRIIAVYTQPDKPAGRGLNVLQSPVKMLALDAELPIYQPSSLCHPETQQILTELHADIMVVAAYGLLLPAAVLAIPRLGCINIHPSLLPRWRGAAPIQRSILAGDVVTGITIMQMDQDLDTGPLLVQHQYAMNEEETSDTLHHTLAKMGAQALIEALDGISQKTLQPIPQEAALATYAPKIRKEEALLDWSQPAIVLERKIRAFNPWPVAHTLWQGQVMRIWEAKALAQPASLAPGRLVSVSHAGIAIATSDGILQLQRLQLPGGKPISANDFYNAKQNKLIVGHLFS